MNITNKINQIKEAFNNTEWAEVFGEAEIAFTEGGCLLFAKVLKKFYFDSEILVNWDLCHCGLYYNGSLYDVTGRIDDDGFEQITDMEEIEEELGLDIDDEVIIESIEEELEIA